MKTGRAFAAILTVLVLAILRQLYHPTVNVYSNIQDVTVDNRSDSTAAKNPDVEAQQSDEESNRAEPESRSEAEESQFEHYSFHEACPCRRTGPLLSQLEQRFNASTLELALRSSKPWKPAYSSYVGNSTCNRHFMLNIARGTTVPGY